MAFDILVVGVFAFVLAIAGVMILLVAITAVADVVATRHQSWGKSSASSGIWYTGTISNFALLTAIGKMFAGTESLVVSAPIDRRVGAFLRAHAERGRGLCFTRNKYRLLVNSEAFRAFVQLADEVPTHRFCVCFDVEEGTTLLFASGDRPLGEDVFINGNLSPEKVRTFQETTQASVSE
jgi:hypothetical protein